MGRSLLRGRLLAGHLVVFAVAVGFGRLGFWQLDRLDQVRARNALVQERIAAPPAELGDLVTSGVSPEDMTYRRVTADGRFLATVPIVTTFRSLEGRPGHYLLAAFVLSDGTAILVNRGWVPLTERSTERPSEATVGYPAPKTEVRVSGILMPSETGGIARGAGALESGRIDVAALASRLGHPLFLLYLQLSQPVSAGSASPQPLPPPELDEGPHLSYAIQWFLFTGIALAGWAIFLRRSSRGSRAQEGATEPIVPEPSARR